MRRFTKLLAAALAVSMLASIIPMTALGSTTKTISSVSISVNLEEIGTGEGLPSESSFNKDDGSSGDYVYSNNSSRYTVNDLEWVTSENREMTIGYEPRMKATLYAEGDDDYVFRGGYQASNVSVKGGTFVSARRIDNYSLEVTFKFKPVKGTYDPPSDAYWKESGFGGARWESVDYSSDAFDVYLYRGSTIMKKVEGLKATSYNFYPYMTKAGTYSFKVRTVPYTENEKKYGKKSDWAESEEIYLPEEKVSDGSGQDNGSGGNTPGNTTQVGWVKTGDTWYYRYPDGTYQKDSWGKINGRWYLFNSSGAMLTGWQKKNNIWYFMNDSGAMVTGWVLSGGKWYYTNPSTTSGVEGAMLSGWISHNNRWYYTDANGVMVEGWYQIDGNWYYFYPGEGSKAVSTNISGFQVDSNGIWRK